MVAGALLGASGWWTELVKSAWEIRGAPKIIQLNHTCLAKGMEIGRTYAPALTAR
jgi:hypothetical protein